MPQTLILFGSWAIPIRWFFLIKLRLQMIFLFLLFYLLKNHLFLIVSELLIQTAVMRPMLTWHIYVLKIVIEKISNH